MQLVLTVLTGTVVAVGALGLVALLLGAVLAPLVDHDLGRSRRRPA
jgi:hypothetical protein